MARKTADKEKKKWDDMTKKEKTKSLIFLVIIILVLFSFIGVVLGDGKKDSPNDSQNKSTIQKETAEKKSVPTAPKAEYEASILNYRAIDPATLNVVVRVKNVSSIEGVPSCTVNMYSESRRYKGFDFFDLASPLKAGEETVFNGNLTIAKEGALYVTEGTATCR
jgi:hypothetical protein